jgi:hypothetical protein
MGGEMERTKNGPNDEVFSNEKKNENDVECEEK